jgi:hypothetical protein
MTKFILSGGYYYKAPDQGNSFCEAIIKDLPPGSIKILDCIFGRPVEARSKRFLDDQLFFSHHVPSAQLQLALESDFVEQITESDVVFFQGGRPEDIMNILNTLPGWKEALRDKTVVGSSGGASMLTQYFGVGKSTSGSPRLGEGLGLLPIKFIPHWKSDHAVDFKADWEGLYEKLSRYKEHLEIVMLADGEFKVFFVD